MWVLPVPLGPRAITFSRRSIHSQRASSSTCILFSFGIALKSKLSRLLVAGELCCPLAHFYSAVDTAGVVRLNTAQSSGLSAETGDSFVDFSPRKSGGRRAKRIRIGGIHEASQ
jgi:hypothetical protein